MSKCKECGRETAKTLKVSREIRWAAGIVIGYIIFFFGFSMVFLAINTGIFQHPLRAFATIMLGGGIGLLGLMYVVMHERIAELKNDKFLLCED